MQCAQAQSLPNSLVGTNNRQMARIKSSNNNNSDMDLPVQNTEPKKDCAVYIRNLCKKYDNEVPVVNNLCMNVPKGTIYGLLGASGCGKTTVLSCIVGLRQWDSGEVLVFGKQPGTKDSGIPGKKLGYVPQELALYNQLSIREILQYYGRIYNMTSSEVSERWMFLTKLLMLPQHFKLIGNLSGGQKRRASLALGLIHSPELLVLDEPTVGLDPLLRISIWNHLYTMVNTLGTTIIITTHYIEEAKFSNTIGIMRKGRLLVEDSPPNLLTTFKMDLLENVVLQLCRKDENSSKNVAPCQTENPVVFKSSWTKDDCSNVVVIPTKEHEQMNGVFRKTASINCDIYKNSRDSSKNNNVPTGMIYGMKNSSVYQNSQRIYGFSSVILLTFIRYPIFLFMILIMPSIQGSITLIIMGSIPKELPIGIVNHDLSNWTTECDMSIHSGESCDLTSLSCKYINQLRTNDLLELRSFGSEEAALSQVQRGNLWGYLRFPHNFSQNSLDRAALRLYASDAVIDGSDVYVHLDYSQSIASFFMVKHILYSYLDYVKSLTYSCHFGDGQAELPMKFVRAVYGNKDDNYTPFIMPGVIISSLLGIVSALTGLLFISDRKSGTLSRARVAGLRTAEVILSHLITQGLVTVGQIIIWAGVLYFVFSFEIIGSQWLCLVFSLLVGLVGAVIGLHIGIMCHDEVEAMVIGVFLCPIFLLFGGVFFPIESMSPFWQWLGRLLPTNIPTQSLRSIVIRGLGITHPLVWPGFLVLIVWIVILPILSAIALRKRY